MILAILASIQHLRVPTLDSAENNYFGLAAGKGYRIHQKPLLLLELKGTHRRTVATPARILMT
jgi:hypothetical protein